MPILDDLLEAAATCPPPPTPRPPSSYDVVLELPASWVAGDRLELQVRPGILDAPGGGLCASLAGRTIRGTEDSEWATFTQPAACQPVPEPGFVLALGFGVLWLVLGAAVSPVLGRALKRSHDRYPTQERPRAVTRGRSLSPPATGDKAPQRATGDR